MKLDDRLNKILSLAIGETFADIGTDHGKVAYSLIEQGAKCVIATDISAPSLKKAEMLAVQYGVTDKMFVRVGNGLEVIENAEVDTVIVAGMGGDLIAKIILSANDNQKQFEHYLLSPNTHSEKVRSALCAVGHKIVVDDIVFANDKAYTVILSEIGHEELTDNELRFGKNFAQSDNFATYAEQKIDVLSAIYNESKSDAISAEIDLFRTALAENKRNLHN